MENASKALLMAGGILIAILILSLAVYLFTTYSKISVTYNDTIESNEKIKFNTNFTKFLGRNDITAQEIVSTINFARDYKESNQIEIKVLVSGSNYVSSNKDLVAFITENADKKYTCAIGEADYKNGMVTCIRFQPT